MKRLTGLFLLVLILLSGCITPKRIKRYLEKNPQFVKVDTITDVRTITVPEEVIDTIFKPTHDTITIEGERIIQKFYYRSDSTVYLYGECKADTIRDTFPVEVVMNVCDEGKADRIKRRLPWYILAAFAGGVLLVFLIRIILRR